MIKKKFAAILVLFGFLPSLVWAADSPLSPELPPAYVPRIYFVSPRPAQTLLGRTVLSAKSEGLRAGRVEFKVEIAGSMKILGLGTYDQGLEQWNFTWDTSEMINGVYNLGVTAYGEFDRVFDSVITVKVHNTEETVATEPFSPLNLTIIEPVNDGAIVGDTILTAKASSVLNGLTFIIDDPQTSQLELSAPATLAKDPKGLIWQFGLKPQKLPDGRYDLSVRADLNGTIFQSSKIQVSIRKKESRPLGKVELIFPTEGFLITGETDFEAQTDELADKLEFKLKSAAPRENSQPSLETVVVGVYNQDREVWSGFFNSDVLASGEYLISVIAYQGSLVLESRTQKIKIANQTDYPAPMAVMKAPVLPSALATTSKFYRPVKVIRPAYFDQGIGLIVLSTMLSLSLLSFKYYSRRRRS